MSKTYRELSNFDYVPNEPRTTKDIEIGCLQRITDATEVIANNYLQLLKDIEDEKKRTKQYEWLYKDERAEKERLQRSIVAHKANYTRLKNKYAALKSENEVPINEQHLPSCGTVYRGCDPNCPKELHEKEQQNG